MKVMSLCDSVFLRIIIKVRQTVKLIVVDMVYMLSEVPDFVTFPLQMPHVVEI